MQTDTRKIVLDILTEYEKEGAMLGPLLNEVLNKYAYLEERDRAFIKKLTEGVVERQIALDHILDRVSDVKSAKMKPMVRRVLRMGTYQIVFMDHVPDRAAVSESLKLMKTKHMDGLKGFVNAVLRAVSRLRDEGIEFPDAKTEHSCPDWIFEKMTEDIGEERTKRLLEAMTAEPPMYLRVNTASYHRDDVIKALAEEGVKVSEVPESVAGLRAAASFNPAASDAFKNGMFSVQDLSSQKAIQDLWVVYVNSDKAKMVDINALDICAAPGGKSCALAELIKDRGSVRSFDISESRIVRIGENIRRLGLSNVSTEVMDAAVHRADLDNAADILIADLPCTGLGVMRRKVDIKYRVKPEDIVELCKLQRRIIDNCITYLKAEGVLLFSVCTLTKEETYDQSEYLRGQGLELVREKLSCQGTEDHDGFYHAVFIKQ